jgi:hypothetical protein
MSDTTSTTDELEADDDTEQTGSGADKAVEDAKPADGESPSSEEKPKRTVGLRKPTGRERGAMAATAMAAVPATGVVGSIVYGNFGPAGLAATAATGLAAGGVALAVRAKRRAEERAKAKGDKPGMLPHPLGGLKGLLAGAKEKAAARRQQMAERRASRQGRGLGGAAGGLASRARAALGRGAGGGGRGAAGAGRTPASKASGRHAAVGKAAANRAVAGKPTRTGRPAAPNSRATGGRVAGRPTAGGRPGSGGRTGGGRTAAGPRGAGAGRYVNPATGRPMSPAQVSKAIRQQQRAQRVVTGNSYPRQLGRWAARHPKAVGIAAAGLGGLAAAVVFAPLAAAAAVGLGAFGVARHPAARAWCATAARGIGRGMRFHGARSGRWLRGRLRAWRRRGDEPEPLDGEIVDEPTAAPEPDIVDAEVVDEPTVAPPKKSIGQPTLVTEPAPEPTTYTPPYRQPRLITAAAANTEENTVSHPFETATEALAGVSFVPESGAHAEAAIDGIPAVLRTAASSITGVISSIAEHLPQGADSLEHLQGIADAVEGIATQADEQIGEWKNCSTWVWQGQD